MLNKIFLLICCLLLAGATKPTLLLAQRYEAGIDVKQYWISEKLDGVRAFWTGQQLLTRGGQVIAAPAWFVAKFPRQAQAEDAQWQQIRYHIFELPNASGTFTERIQAMQALSAKHQSPYLQVIPQFRLANHAELMTKLTALEQQGAEGLMLHHQDAHYKTGRSSDLLKLKSYQDTEAEVIGYRPGKGKYQGMVGALVVKTPDGKTFAIGSGLTDALRQNPPPLGTMVTYRYNGFTNKGLPRFARFLRIRQPLE